MKDAFKPRHTHACCLNTGAPQQLWLLIMHTWWHHTD